MATTNKLEGEIQHARRFLENLSAISAEFHKDRRYQNFYKGQASKAGFVEIWMYMIDAAEAFCRAEDKLKVEWDGQWVAAIDAYVDELIIANCLLKPNALFETAWSVVNDRQEIEDAMNEEDENANDP